MQAPCQSIGTTPISKLKFNSRTSHSNTGKEQEIKYATTYKSYDDSDIDDKEQVRDVGIMMSNTATFTLHIRNIVKKARDKIGWVLRVFQLRECCLMLTLLKSLVIPLLEYCCQLFNPCKAKDIQAIEAIQ